jgi:hypothetical protein
MKKTLLVFFVLISTLAVGVNAQDIITKKNGEDIKAKVLEITLNELKYKNFNNLEGPIVSIAKSDVIFVKYENGTKDVFGEDRLANTSSPSGLDNEKMALVGKADARRYYKGYSIAGAGTLVTGLFTGSLFALIPAIATTSSEPKEANLQYPNSSLLNNSSYVNAYNQEAFKIKKRKVWNNYFIALIANVATYAILVSR